MKKNTFQYKPLNIALLIISGALFIYSLIFHLVGAPVWFPFGVAVLSLLVALWMGEPDIFKKSFSSLLASLKRVRLSIILIIICDIGIFVLAGGALFLAGSYIDSKATIAGQDLDIYSIAANQDIQAAATAVDRMGGLLYLMLGLYVVLLVWLALVYSVLKCVIWFLSNDLSPKPKDILSFFLLNVFYLPLIVTALIILSIALKPEVAGAFIVIAALLAFHMTIVLNGVFVHKKAVWSSLSAMLHVAYRKARYFVIPYLLIWSLLYLIMVSSVGLRIFPAEFAGLFMVLIVLPLVFSVARIYLAQVIKEHIP